ncbi:MAG TPA: squalene/phytoene synthase family protein [Steroidobacteraceae bacterium]
MRSPGDSNPGGAQQPAHAPHMLSASRYLAWVYSPAPQQPVLARLCEIESEIAGSLRPGIDHHVAHARLQWWREECERCAQGRPVHPLTRELVKAFGTITSPSPLAGISGFVDTAVWDLAGATFETRKELTAYCERWATAMFETLAGTVTAPEARSAENAHSTRARQAANMMRASDATTPVSAVTDPPNAATSDHISNAPTTSVVGVDGSVPGADSSRWLALGAAVREIELLADLAREAHLGRLRVPLDELERAGVEVKSLASPLWPAPLATLLRERHEALRATLAQCVDPLGREQQMDFRGLFVWAALAWRQSTRAQRGLPNIISPRRYHAVADGWLAWRAARRAAAGNLRLS